MRDWTKYWATLPVSVGRDQYLEQVGKVFQGKTLSDEAFNWMIDQICERLDLQENDVLLDLCCGNGVITKRLADRVARVVGVDYSQPLIDIAWSDHAAPNVSYVRMPAQDTSRESLGSPDGFSKVLMYEALQHFPVRDFSNLLNTIVGVTRPGFRLLFGSVPDRARRWAFFNTPKRRMHFYVRKLLRNDAIGSWWDRQFMTDRCDELDLVCEFHEQDPVLHTAHYRFDVTIRPRKTS